MNKHAQRGSVILYALLIIAVMLSISLALIGVTMVRHRSVSQAKLSTIALFASDSAVEMCLYEARYMLNYNDPASTMNDGTLNNGAAFTIEDVLNPGTMVQDDCSVLGSSSFSFRAVSSYFGTISRALEISQ